MLFAEEVMMSAHTQRARTNTSVSRGGKKEKYQLSKIVLLAIAAPVNTRTVPYIQQALQEEDQ